MRHLAIISEHASPLLAGGEPEAGRQNEYVAQLAERAVQHGFAVDVFTRRTDPGLPEMIPWRPGVRVVHVDAGPPRMLPREELLPCMGEFAERVLEFTRRDQVRYDVMHANSWTAGYVAAIIKRAMGVPFVVTFHALGKVRRQHASADGFPMARPIIEERVMQEADAIIAACPDDEHALCTLYDVSGSRLSAIPLGVDLDRFRPVTRASARGALDLPANDTLLLSVGRLVPHKGFDDVIRALGVLRRKHHLSPRWLVIGDQPARAADEPADELARLRHLAREEGVSDRVQFLSSCPPERLPTYYAAADLFLTAPRYEPFGVTAIEAMACGTPVIGTRVGGLKLTVQHGLSGLLVPPQDPGAFAEAVATMIRSPEERATLGRQGLHWVRGNFGWADVVTRITRLYAEVVDRTQRVPVHAGDAPVLRIRPHPAAAAEFRTRASA